MKLEALVDVLSDPRVNVSGLCKGINKKGLSRSSLLNKLNEDHHHKMNQEDLDTLKDELKALSLFILGKIE